MGIDAFAFDTKFHNCFYHVGLKAENSLVQMTNICYFAIIPLILQLVNYKSDWNVPIPTLLSIFSGRSIPRIFSSLLSSP